MQDTAVVEGLQRAWNKDLEFSKLIDIANQCQEADKTPLAVVLYQTWLSRNASPYAYAIWFNLGVALNNLGELDGAEQAYLRVLELDPAFPQARLNLGLLHERRGRTDAAVEAWRWVVDQLPRDETNRPFVVMALNNLGRLLESRKMLDAALDYLTQSLQLDPQQPDAIHHWVFLRMKLCRWPVYDPLPGLTEVQMRAATSALAMLALSDDPADQLQAARQFVDKRTTHGLPQLAPTQGYCHERVRIAYCSSDFCLHPVSLLTVQLFELHDRSRFEVYAFSWSPDDGSPLRERVIRAMDHFIPIHHLSDREAAELIRHHEIDILVDLQGQTAGARVDMLGYRPAPVQITYLGQPATTGLPSIDYVIADEFLILPEMARFYTEKPLYMPDVYQVSDRLRAEAPAPTRASYGLPEDAVVLCSFNNSYKYTPEVFAAWMRILQRVPSAILWLVSEHPSIQGNLREQAQLHGVDPARLLFAERLAPEHYLARFRVVDLFLDTFPFNAGTTANDALWMGCPLLTLSGRSFASRMAGALLTAADLSELITYDLATYESQAVALASDPVRCRALRERLGEVRDHGRLFDTPRFVRELESRLLDLVPHAVHVQANPGTAIP